MTNEANDPVFGVSMSSVDGHCLIDVSGELDAATRNLCFEACVTGDSRPVVVDMTALTFMDCAGYGALVEARRVLETRGASLSLQHPTGQPGYLLGFLGGIAEWTGAHEPARS